MTKLLRTAQARFLSSRSGATAIEYALIAGLIGLAIVGGATELGLATSESFEAVQAGFD